MALFHQLSTPLSFLMWFWGNFIYTGLVGVVNEYCNFVSAITSDHDLALGPLLLSTLYRDIFHFLKYLEDNRTEYNIVFGLIWFLVLKAQLYFLNALYLGTALLETKQEDTCYRKTLICLLKSKASAFSIANQLLTVEFSLCFSLTPLHCWLAGSYQTLVDITTLNEGSIIARHNWAATLTSHYLLFGIKLTSRNNKLAIEAYYPQCFARQFGLVESIPQILSFPICLLVNLCTSCQPNEISSVLENIEDKLHSFVFRCFDFSPSSADFFTEQWGVISVTLFHGSIVDFLTQLIDDMLNDELPSSTPIRHSQKRMNAFNLVVRDGFSPLLLISCLFFLLTSIFFY